MDQKAESSRGDGMPAIEAPTSKELATLAQHGGAFEWLADEPDIYSANDGEPL